MSPAETFLRFAADCERMAHVVRDPASRADWRRLAEAWLRNAKAFDSRRSAAREQAHQRKRATGYSH
jgi:hypothetical protein